MTRLSCEDESRIIEMYDMGFSTREIGGVVHWGQNAVLCCLRRNEIEIRPRGGSHQTISGREIKQVRFLHDVIGYSQSDIAKILGHSNDWVNRRVKKGGIKPRPCGYAAQPFIKQRLKEAA